MAKKKRTGIAMPDSPDDWRARDDLHTLSRAEEIRRDSERLSAAQKEADRQRESLARIRRLKDVKV